MKFFNFHQSKLIEVTIIILISFSLISFSIEVKTTKLSNLNKENTKTVSLSLEKTESHTTRFLRRNQEYLEVDKFYKNEKEFLSNPELVLDSYAAITFNTEKKEFTLINKRDKEDIDDDCGSIIAEVIYIKQRYDMGWDKLSVKSYNNNANAFLQSYIAGYLEGRITAQDIHTYINGKAKETVDTKSPTWNKIIDFFETISKNLEKKISQLNEITDKAEQLKWNRLLLGYAQLKGMFRGYMYEAKRKKLREIKISNLFIVQADGELHELEKAIKYLSASKAERVKYDLSNKNYFKNAFGIDSKKADDIWTDLVMSSRCSAFVKLLKDGKKALDLMVGHTTWGEAVETLRTYKYNSFEYENNEELPSSSMTFSAYPGTLSSTDDYYITNNNIVITETTIEVVDINAYRKVKTAEAYLPNYMRVLSASRFAKSAKEWVEMFKQDNSGTYSSQWLVIDYNIFEKIKNKESQTHPKELFYILEQTPNKIVHYDVSKYLWKKQFFGGYNRAFFNESNINLNSALLNKLYGKVLSDYDASRRGRQFKSLEKDVKGLKSIMDIMRYNGYKLNKFKGDSSNSNPSEAIAARYDLRKGGQGFIGGVDSKVTNSEFTKKLIAITVNGPTNDIHNKNIPPFKLSQENSKLLGLPIVLKFPYIKIDPETMEVKSTEFKFEDNEKLNLK